MYKLGFLLLFGILFSGCKKDTANKYNQLVYPSHFPEPHYNFKDNPYSYDGFLLGRKLFFDPILSVDNTVSCGTCHAPVHAFADHNIKLSLGVENRQGVRNSPAVFNMLWNKSFMWDGGINNIEVMPIAPITDHREMAETIENVVKKLNEHKEYPTLFKNAFKNDLVDSRNMLLALAQFMGSIISSNSKYDQYVLGKYTLSADEKAGLSLFRTHCESCHKEPLFTNYEFINNGIDSVFKDLGRKKVTDESADLGKFKVPTLRNIMLTYPYMHDGRFKNIDEVLNHYSNGVIESATLDNRLKNGISLEANEKKQIKAFLSTLNDFELIGDLEINEH